MGKRARLKRLKEQKERSRQSAGNGNEDASPAGSTFIKLGPGTPLLKIRFDSAETTSTDAVVGQPGHPVDLRGHLVHAPEPGPGNAEVRNLVIGGGHPDCPTCQKMLENARRRSPNPEIFSD
jgi:hypothetical protein